MLSKFARETPVEEPLQVRNLLSQLRNRGAARANQTAEFAGSEERKAPIACPERFYDGNASISEASRKRSVKAFQLLSKNLDKLYLTKKNYVFTVAEKAALDNCFEKILNPNLTCQQMRKTLKTIGVFCATVVRAMNWHQNGLSKDGNSLVEANLLINLERLIEKKVQCRPYDVEAIDSLFVELFSSKSIALSGAAIRLWTSLFGHVERLKYSVDLEAILNRMQREGIQIHFPVSEPKGPSYSLDLSVGECCAVHF